MVVVAAAAAAVVVISRGLESHPKVGPYRGRLKNYQNYRPRNIIDLKETWRPYYTLGGWGR